MRWVPTSMGYFYQGRHYPRRDPISLLTFPHLGFIDKIRYGLMAFLATKRTTWADLDKITADEWLKRWCGARAPPAFVQLSRAQLRELVHAAGRQPLFVEAGAGTGKTKQLVDRVVALVLDAGVPMHAHAFSGLVYRQIIEMFQGVRGEAATRALIVQENMRYARRQLTWFRHEPDVTWLEPGQSPLSLL